MYIFKTPLSNTIIQPPSHPLEHPHRRPSRTTKMTVQEFENIVQEVKKIVQTKPQPKIHKFIPNERVKYDFLDKEWIRKPSITLHRYSDKQIALIGRAVMPMLSSGFTGQGVAAVFELAFHLKAPGTDFKEFIFNPDKCLENNIPEKSYSGYWDKIVYENGLNYGNTGKCDFTREAAVYSYIAVSLFRLFTMPVSDYMSYWFSTVKKFGMFYNEPMNVVLPFPNESALKILKDCFYVHERAKVTLYRFLYMSNSDERYKDLKGFLYDNKLSNSGMHIVSIVKKLSDELKCKPRVIVAAIDDIVTEKQKKCLVRLVELLAQNDWNHEKKMWRYGRLFDKTFMSDIQTKSCQELVYILAEALRSEAAEKHSGVLQIFQLGDLSVGDKARCAFAAQQILIQLKSQISRSI